MLQCFNHAAYSSCGISMFLRLYLYYLLLFSERLLPNGDLNWSCRCIEKLVCSPCNVEFRRLAEIEQRINQASELEEDVPDAVLTELAR